ncbi:MAG: HNH endonuclease [bacterium]
MDEDSKLFYDTPVWKMMREMVLLGAGYTCTRCGAPGKQVGGTAILQIHHNTYIRFGGNEELSDLECLCKECHKKEHKKWKG